MKKLLIVESPTKARTIGRILDSSYEIKASMGHIRDLPERKLGVDVEHDFAPVYVDTPRSAKIVQELKRAAADADEIYLAPDPDREGEAIAWHLYNVLANKKNQDRFHRVTFHEITRNAILNALRQTGQIDQDLVDAQQARRVLDRIVGYKISPLLWSQIAKGISAGRVQSVALRLIVEREREISGFQPQEYWVFELVLRSESGAEFRVKLLKIDGKNFEVGAADEAEKCLAAILSGDAPRIVKIDRGEKKRSAIPPFTTSTLQQSANTALHYSASSTMKYAQELYEGLDTGNGVAGLITYMRTDSVNIAREAQLAAADFIVKTFGKEYAPDRFNVYKSKASAQEAHEAIRPTDVNRTPESLKPYLSDQQLKIYTLIWRRFVASQMTPCRYNQTTVDVGVKGADHRDYLFRAGTSVISFPGYTAVYPDRDDTEAQESSVLLNSLREGESATILNAEKEQKFTEPPPHYSEASLIKALEENGIGRPSTYATILRTIQTRKYVQHEKGKLLPTDLGYKVNDFLVANLNDLFDVGFTAEMENKLDKVESGAIRWTDMLHEFYGEFEKWLGDVAKQDAPPPEHAGALLQLLSGVEFPKVEKGARKGFDDGKFYRSLQRQQEKGKPLSGKQFNALLKLAAKYRDKLPPPPPELADALKQSFAELEEKNAAAPNDAERPDYAPLFAAFAKVSWEQPTARRGRTFDDKAFFDSLAHQAEAGRMLSPKQLAVLRRMAEKYHGELTEPEKVDAILGIAAPGAAAAAGEGTAAEAPEAKEDLAPFFSALGNVKEWAAPTKRGRFTYDDKAFFESLKKQYDAGRTLSEKQIAALKKLAGKYCPSEEQPDA